MKALEVVRPGERVKLLCLGAHSDDIEIGAGGTILSWLAAGVELDVHWCVATAGGERLDEARASADEFLTGAVGSSVESGHLRNGYLPYQGEQTKDWVESLKHLDPDLILTHRREDAHQDHRFLSELASQVFRDNLILEFEIPKWDGDVGQPNYYIPISERTLARKIALLEKHFCTQKSRDWFDPETFRGLARLRGMESRAPEQYAEAFVLRKATATLRCD